MINPKRGEVWIVEFEPNVGTEIRKTRPALVLSIPELRSLTTKIIVPFKDYKISHEDSFFFVPVESDEENGLFKKSTLDCSQVKSFDYQRFQKKLGKISGEELEDVAKIVTYCIGYSVK